MTAAAPAASPLLALGPAGWAAFGLIVVGSIVVTAVIIDQASDDADESFPDREPGCTQGCEEASDDAPPKSVPVPTWEPIGDETHPDHDDVEDAMREYSNNCYRLAVAIETLVRDLRFRRWDMQRHGGGNRGHRTAYYLRREALQRLVETARALGCPYNPEADAEIGRSHSYPTPYY